VRDPIVAMTIAGSDSGGGAGIQADLKSFAAHGVFGTSVITALTAQNTAAVLGVDLVDPAFVDLQIEAVLDDLAVAGVKTGMLASAATVGVVARWAAAGRLPHLVVDPVMVSGTGHPLVDEAGVEAYRRVLLPLAEVTTPNIREAALLVGAPVVDVASMKEAAAALGSLGPATVVIKGGHLAGPDAPDVVWHRAAVTVVDGPRVTSTNDHGTGCSLAASIAALLALGYEPLDAISRAKAFVATAIEGAAGWHLGAGHGPLDHFGWGAENRRRD
jgi:hydroxymethylpyrimidine/phosphomethylpyrimidine kinase